MKLLAWLHANCIYPCDLHPLVHKLACPLLDKTRAYLATFAARNASIKIQNKHSSVARNEGEPPLKNTRQNVFYPSNRRCPTWQARAHPRDRLAGPEFKATRHCRRIDDGTREEGEDQTTGKRGNEGATMWDETEWERQTKKEWKRVRWRGSVKERGEWVFERARRNHQPSTPRVGFELVIFSYRMHPRLCITMQLHESGRGAGTHIHPQPIVYRYYRGHVAHRSSSYARVIERATLLPPRSRLMCIRVVATKIIYTLPPVSWDNR